MWAHVVTLDDIGAPIDAERKLFSAILFRAIKDLASKTQRADAKRFLRSRTGREMLLDSLPAGAGRRLKLGAILRWSPKQVRAAVSAARKVAKVSDSD